jgi:hypothetical protein
MTKSATTTPQRGMNTRACAKELHPATAKWRELSAAPDHLMQSIVDYIAEGKGLTAFAKRHGIAFSTAWFWIDADQTRRDAYDNALLSGATFLAEQASEILMQEPRTLENGATDNGWVSLMRARSDQLKWLASKMFPRRFGDRQQVDISQTGVSITLALAEARQRVAGFAIEGECSVIESDHSRAPSNV